MIDTNKCTFEEKHTDPEYGTVYYFIYPKDGMNETEFYSEADYGKVVSTCISLTITDDGSYYMQMSPTVEEDDGLSDVDWRDLFPDENYDETTVRELLKLANIGGIRMKTFEVVVHYEGAFNYEIEAENEEQAKAIAEATFEDEKDRTIVQNLADVSVCDCWEVK